MESLSKAKRWLVRKLEDPGYEQLQRDAIIDKMGVTFTVALPKRIPLPGRVVLDPKWPQVQITPFMWETDHRLFIVPHGMPLNLLPGDQVVFTYHSRDHSGGCCPLVTPYEVDEVVEFLESKGERPDGFLCAMCFKHISPDDKYTKIPPNYYHENCISHLDDLST